MLQILSSIMRATTLLLQTLLVKCAIDEELSAEGRALLCDASVEFPRERSGVIRWLHVPKMGRALRGRGCAGA